MRCSSRPTMLGPLTPGDSIKMYLFWGVEMLLTLIPSCD